MSEVNQASRIEWDRDPSIKTKLIVALQHVLTMFPSAITVPLILSSALNLDSETTSFLISSNLIASGVGVLIQSLGIGSKIGSKLPVAIGSSIAPLGPMIMIGQKYGFPTLIGSIIASGIILYFIAFSIEKIVKLFPSIVIGSFITSMGISLAPIAMRNIAGGEGAADFGSLENLLLGIFVVLTIVLVGKFGKGMLKTSSLLVGILGGCVIAIVLGKMNFQSVADAKLFSLVKPFGFGMPVFRLDTIIIMTIFITINVIQCLSVFSILDLTTGSKTDIETKERGIKGMAVAQVISGIFNSVPLTMLNENVGVIQMTKVKDRYIMNIVAIALVVLGFFPKFAEIITIIPAPVIGGLMLVVFGIITHSGISVLMGVDFSKGDNLTIVGLSLMVGIGVNFAPEIFDKLPETLKMLLSNGLFMTSVTAMFLNWILNKDITDIKFKDKETSKDNSE